MDGRCCTLTVASKNIPCDFESSINPMLTSNRLRMDYIKTVVNPIRQVAPRRSLRGLQEDYGNLTADVVLLAGEVHHDRKPVSWSATTLTSIMMCNFYEGSLRFTSAANRDMFSRVVLYNVRPPYKVFQLASTLSA